MSKQEIVFVIRSDGTVEETTSGLLGADCEAVTAPIEQHLGEVVGRQATAERYQPAAAGDGAQQQGQR
ncbi:MAG: DUF2997 domain-containing protein [Fimbriimonadaceae bacterium]|nr:DUF2997 domain-containing protein [Fimbriimonadaceae bacterium]